MNRNEIRDGIAEVLKEILKLQSIELSDSTTARDFKGWDSLTHIDIIFAVEDKFHISIPIFTASKLNSVGELVTFIFNQKNHV